MDSNAVFITITNNASPLKNASTFTIKPFEVTDVLKFDKEPYCSLADSNLGMNLIDVVRTMYEGSCLLVDAMTESNSDESYRKSLDATLGKRRISYTDLLRYISSQDLAEFSRLITTAILDTSPEDIHLERVSRAVFESVFKRHIKKMSATFGTYVKFILPVTSVSVSVNLSRTINVVFDVDLTGLGNFEDCMLKIMDETFEKIFTNDGDEMSRSILTNLLRNIHKPEYGFADKIHHKLHELEYSLYAKDPVPGDVDLSNIRPEHGSIDRDILEQFASLRTEVNEESVHSVLVGAYSSFQTPGAPAPSSKPKTTRHNHLYDRIYADDGKLIARKPSITETRVLVEEIVRLKRNYRKYTYAKTFLHKLSADYAQSSKGIEEFRKCVDKTVDDYKKYNVELYEKDLPFMQTIL
jgi:hypothetical protein